MKSSVVIKLAVLVLGAVLSLSAYAISDKNRAAIEERIKPVGQVCLEGDDKCGSAVASSGGASAAKSPEDIYNSSCNACHGTGAAGAPKLGDAGAWAARLGQGKDVLYAHAVDGFNGMPPKGLCMSCSEDEIKATVDYIIENSQ